MRCGLVLVVPFAHGQTPAPTVDVTVTASTTDATDNWIGAEYPDTSGGSDATCSAYAGCTDCDVPLPAQAILQFNDLLVPEGGTLVDATLQLWTTDTTFSGPAAWRMEMAWDDATTWNSIGGGVTVGGGWVYSFALISPTANAFVTVDVTADVTH